MRRERPILALSVLGAIFVLAVSFISSCSSGEAQAHDRVRERELLKRLQFGPDWTATMTRVTSDELGNKTEQVFWGSGQEAWIRLLRRIRSIPADDPLWEFRASIGPDDLVRSIRSSFDRTCEVYASTGVRPWGENLDPAVRLPSVPVGIGLYVSARCRTTN